MKTYMIVTIDVSALSDEQGHTLAQALLAQCEGLPIEGMPIVEIETEDRQAS